MKKIAASFSALAMALLNVPSHHAAASTSITPGLITGRVEVGAGVPATTCGVRVLGSPVVGSCDPPSEQLGPGWFRIYVQPGSWNLEISVPGFEPKQILLGVNEGQNNVGIVMGPTATIRGWVLPAPDTSAQDYVVAFRQAGLYAVVDSRGAFLLPGVPAGERRRISLMFNGAAVSGSVVEVSPGGLTDGIILADPLNDPFDKPRPGPPLFPFP